MNSSVSSAAARRCPPGDESTGLPATVISALIWPGPGVSISSARQVIGSSPKTSGAPLTRLRVAPGGDAAADARLAAGVVREGGRPREHRAAGLVEVAGEHVEHVDEPRRQRAETLGAGAEAPVDAGRRSRRRVHAPGGGSCRRRCRSAPPRARARTAARPGARRRRRPRAARARPSRTRPSSNSVCTIAASRKASAPGRMKWCSSASGRGLGAARVDHDDAAAARAQRLGLAAEVGHRPQAAVADQRVGAEDQQVARSARCRAPGR